LLEPGSGSGVRLLEAGVGYFSRPNSRLTRFTPEMTREKDPTFAHRSLCFLCHFFGGFRR